MAFKVLVVRFAHWALVRLSVGLFLASVAFAGAAAWVPAKQILYWLQANLWVDQETLLGVLCESNNDYCQAIVNPQSWFGVARIARAALSIPYAWGWVAIAAACLFGCFWVGARADSKAWLAIAADVTDSRPS